MLAKFIDKDYEQYKNVLVPLQLQDGSLEIFFGYFNHATFQIIGISIKSGPYLQLISHCVRAKLNFTQKCIEIDCFSSSVTSIMQKTVISAL